MSDVVFILGAGASKDSGGPLMAEFLDTASNLLLTGRIEDEKIRQQFELVFSVIGKLQTVHSKAQLDLDNIESIFTVLELGKVIKKIPGLEASQIPETITALKALIVNTLQQSIKFPVTPQGYIGAPHLYDQFASLISYIAHTAYPKNSVSVITFNYDIAADTAMMRAGLGPRYCIEGDVTDERTIPLLKLHGSLNWATEKHRKAARIRPVRLDKYFSIFSASSFATEISIPIASQFDEYFKRTEELTSEIDTEPLLVPPSWNKADYHSTLSDIWSAAAHHLSEAKDIYIIGYSLATTDSFFRHLYALGCVGDAPLRRIRVYDPDDSGEIDARFRSLLGTGAIARYKHEKKYFSEALTLVKEYYHPR